MESKALVVVMVEAADVGAADVGAEVGFGVGFSGPCGGFAVGFAVVGFAVGFAVVGFGVGFAVVGFGVGFAVGFGVGFAVLGAGDGWGVFSFVMVGKTAPFRMPHSPPSPTNPLSMRMYPCSPKEVPQLILTSQYFRFLSTP